MPPTLLGRTKLNKAVVKDLPKQTARSFGRSHYRRGETVFVIPSPTLVVIKPTELVGKLTDLDKISRAWWLTLYDNGGDSFLENDLHKLILAAAAPPIIESRAKIERFTYEICPWDPNTQIGAAIGHIVVEKFTSVDHQGRPTRTPEHNIVEIVLNGKHLYP